MSVTIDKIKFCYENFSLEADLEIPTGEFVSVLGPSGCGKTTLLRLIAGFQTPNSGRIVIEGRDLTGVPTSRRDIGMVFQDYALFPHMNVFQNISYGLKYRNSSRTNIPGGSIASRVSELLDIVSLNGYEKRSVNELSGGEKQRVALARAIAPGPELLLFDEPLSALDIKLRKNLRKEIRRIQREVGFTALYVTHDQEEAMSISDRIAVMNEGRIIQTGSPEQLYYSPENFFTADFIGIMNRITIKREIMFRPEACRLADDPNVPENGLNYIKLKASIKSAEFAGGFYLCEARTEKDESLIFYSEKKLPDGNPVELILKKDMIIDCC